MRKASDATSRGGRPAIDPADPRAVRTRAKLVTAFHQAVQEADPSEMSVAALARAAGINRSSFYAHFSSPEDLAIHALGDVFDMVGYTDDVLRSEHFATAAEASRRALSDVVWFVHQRRAPYARLLGPGAAPAVVRAITDAFAQHTAAALTRMATRPPEIDPTITAQFLAGGVLGVLGRWLADEPSDWPADRLVEALVQCLPSWLTTD